MFNHLLIITAKEFRDGLRNRWVLSLSVLFAVMAIGLSYFGAAASGQAGFSSLPTTMVSLATLVVLLIPLIALMLAYDSVVGEEERGTLLLLISYPVQRWQFICGKMLGHGLTLACAIAIGFALSAVVTGLFSDSAGWVALLQAYGFFTLFSILLGWVFIAMAYMVSVHAREKSGAAVMALLLWFIFVLMFDMLLLGILVTTQGNVNEVLFPFLLLLNPAEDRKSTRLNSSHVRISYAVF